MFINYCKTAWRSLSKNKLTTLINITGLSVGMTAAVLILLWVQNETSFDNYKDKQRIYRLTTRIPALGWVWETTPLLLADAIKKEIPEIENTARLYVNNEPVFKVRENLFYGKDCAYVDDGWFSLFQYDFREGNAASFSKNPFSIILTSSEAKKYFGSEKVVGQTVHIDSMNYRVSGVVADAPANSSFQYKAFIPIAALLKNTQIRENDEQWDNANYITFIKIDAGSQTENTVRKINDIVKKNAKGEDPAPISLISLGDLHFENEIQNSAFVHGSHNSVYIFSVLALVLLLIACINYVNLTTAKAGIRAKEVSIRKMTGANRSNLFLQFVVESILISVLALLATLVLIQLVLPLFDELTGKPFSLSITAPVLWRVVGITLLTATLLNSIYPALLLSSFKPLQVFQGKSALKIRDRSFRKGLVVLQFTISVILIAATLVIYRQLQFIQNSKPGYNRSQVLSFVLPPTTDRSKRESLMQIMKQELLSQAGIESVTTSNQTIVDMGSYCTGCADWAGHDTSYNPKIAQLSADADFQKTMQLQMREGRWFREEGNGTEKHAFILNETAVKDFKLRTPVVGQRLVFKGDTGQVIGVVKNILYKSMHEKMGPLVVFNNPEWRSHFAVRVAPKNVSAALTGIGKLWKKYLRDSPFEYTFLEDTFNNLYKTDQQTSLLMLVFALIAILICGLGLFSLSAFEAEQRTKEIGIRKVLGASVANITALLSTDFLKPVGIAIAIAFPVAWWAMSQWIQNFAYRIDLSWWLFVLAGIVAVAIAILTVSFQAIKAAIANPVKSLRSE